MASSPDTTVLRTPVSHPRLPFDVELLIVHDLIEVYKRAQKRLAPLATVSETWQRIVEKHTFQYLRLGEQDLLDFGKFVHRGRLQLVKSITLDRSPWRELCVSARSLRLRYRAKDFP
ncbi:hypothetical protein H9Q69_007946 [Fusarium xylarioides]|uniref:F-box domain-containing protein n=1 Tax=Fusarium xylarioides TaxID=221167 RepID=A0A9P7I397_9HYPO|nr:hypothetical protein H9Q70_008845 [Fusarium xylarioides]KAG5766649.1 hypothetical protein H9Q72_005313 [Fusarium xylarioides]KAG5775703.1 hypothetical protein H9Q73_010637 [Fusarium xylarioides]KAG5793027.1 hypothetical protein H9Q69_007946 [Fusarium xylarioides]KAG5810249.1 hypothetical protein H9Q71_005606 [Fusarium xylarioides]